MTMFTLRSAVWPMTLSPGAAGILLAFIRSPPLRNRLSHTDDPRVQRTRAAVLRATIELMAEGGPEAITHQVVARRAGVGRATLYRHWPSAEELVFAALAEIVSGWTFSSSGDLARAIVD